MVRNAVAVLKKIRTLLVMGLLIVALSMLNFFLGCEPEDEKVLYGPAPEDLKGDENVLYGPPVQEVYPEDEAAADTEEGDVTPEPENVPEVAPLYGVQVDAEPADVVEDVPDDQLPEEAVVYYGPMPVDGISEDTINDVTPESKEEFRMLYGPQPVDVVDEVADTGDDKEIANYYGPQPLYGVPGAR